MQDAYEALSNAIDNLVLMVNLEELVTAMEGKLSEIGDYSTASWTAFAVVLNRAQNVLADGGASQEAQIEAYRGIGGVEIQTLYPLAADNAEAAGSCCRLGSCDSSGFTVSIPDFMEPRLSASPLSVVPAAVTLSFSGEAADLHLCRIFGQKSDLQPDYVSPDRSVFYGFQARKQL